MRPLSFGGTIHAPHDHRVRDLRGARGGPRRGVEVACWRVGGRPAFLHSQPQRVAALLPESLLSIPGAWLIEDWLLGEDLGKAVWSCRHLV